MIFLLCFVHCYILGERNSIMHFHSAILAWNSQTIMKDLKQDQSSWSLDEGGRVEDSIGYMINFGFHLKSHQEAC